MNWLKLSYIAGGSECKLVKQIWKIFSHSWKSVWWLSICLIYAYPVNHVCISFFILSLFLIYISIFISVCLFAIYLQNCKFPLITLNVSPTPQNFSSLQHSISLYRSFSNSKGVGFHYLQYIYLFVKSFFSLPFS